jgi:hypothetical protein
MGVVPSNETVVSVIKKWAGVGHLSELTEEDITRLIKEIVDDQQTIAKFVHGVSGAGYEGKEPCQHQLSAEDCEKQGCRWADDVCGPKIMTGDAYIDDEGTLVLGSP